MPQTPLTAATPYATAADLFVYTPWQTVGELLRDAGSPTPQRASLTNTAHPLGTWTLVSGKDTKFSSGTALRRDQIKSIQITSPSGSTLLQLNT